MQAPVERALAVAEALEAAGFQVQDSSRAAERAAWGSDLFPVTTPFRRIVYEGAPVGFVLLDQVGGNRLVFERAREAARLPWERVYDLVVDHLAPGDAFYA